VVLPGVAIKKGCEEGLGLRKMASTSAARAGDRRLTIHSTPPGMITSPARLSYTETLLLNVKNRLYLTPMTHAVIEQDPDEDSLVLYGLLEVHEWLLRHE
jgi:hypothetical protein